MYTIVLLILLGIFTWFAVVNAAAVSISLIFWTGTISLALVIFLTLLIGFVCGILFLLPGYLRYRHRARVSGKELATVQKDHAAVSERAQVLEDQVKQLAPMRNRIPSEE